MAMTTPSNCRSCGAAIIWATMPSGKKNPLDAEPSLIGNVRLGDGGTAAPLRDAEILKAREDGEALYISHFATCQNAAQHRRK